MPSITPHPVLAPEPDRIADWLDGLRAHLPPDLIDELTPAEEAALLDLARVAAHRADRRAAPITTYLAGRALAPLHRCERLERLQELLTALEAQP